MRLFYCRGVTVVAMKTKFNAKVLLVILMILVAALALVACTPGDQKNQDQQGVRSIAVDGFTSLTMYSHQPFTVNEGAVVVITYYNGKTESVALTADMIEGYRSDVIGLQTVTVRYGDQTTTLSVTVVESTVQRIEIESAPSVIQVVEGDYLSMKGVVLRVYYQTGSTLYSLDAYTEIDETSSVVTGYRRSFTPGFYTVTIHYVKQTVTTTIEVIAKDVVAVAVASKPTKDAYFVGDELETAGLTFAYTYNNGDTAVVTYDEAVAAGDALSVDYDFDVQLAESRVQTTFRFETSEGNPIVATFTVLVRTPSVLRVDLIRNPVSFGVTQNVVVREEDGSFSYYPEAESKEPSSIDGLIQGERINLETGLVRLTYDDGTVKETDLTDIAFTISDQNGRRIDSQTVFSEPGTYNLTVRYGNDAATTLTVVVKKRTALQLILADPNGIVGLEYWEGDSLRGKTSMIRYNIQYDNGEFAVPAPDPVEKVFDLAAIQQWPTLSESMLAIGSNATFSYTGARSDVVGEGGTSVQTVAFTVENVTAGFDFVVKENALLSVDFTAPADNYVAVGDNVVSIAGGKFLLTYLNNNFRTVELTFPMLSYYSEDGLTPVTHFDESGVYLVRPVVTDGTYTVADSAFEYFVIAEDPAVTEVRLIDRLGYTPEYKDRAAFEADLVNNPFVLRVTDSRNNIYEVNAEQAEIYRMSNDYIGTQTVQLRYHGFLVDYAVKLSGRAVTSISVKQMPRTVYYLDPEAPVVLDLSDLKIERRFNDNTSGVVEYAAFDYYWNIVLPDLTTLGTKSVLIEYRHGENLFTCSFEIEIRDLADEVVSIAFDPTQNGMTEVAPGEYRLVVSRGEDLNVTPFYISVVYSGSSEPVDVKLQRGYVTFDPNAFPYQGEDFVADRDCEIRYGNRTAILPVRVTERKLTGIEVVTLPDRFNYVEGQLADLSGGQIKRVFEDKDGTVSYDIISMTDPLIQLADYVVSPFENAVGTDQYVDQIIRVVYGSYSLEVPVRTYRRQHVAFEYLDSVSFYGDVKTPTLSLRNTVEGFVLPGWSIAYYVEGVWTDRVPSVPGEYPMQVTIDGNQYYLDEVIEERSLFIIAKIITVQAYPQEKFYGDPDPEFRYFIAGDSLVGDDVLGIRMLREPGENVKFNETGGYAGYQIKFELVAGDNDNDRYRILFKYDNLTIKQRVIESSIDFMGGDNLVEDGTPKRIIAVYRLPSGDSVSIGAGDLVYRKDGAIIEGAPVEAGEYTVTISDNYVFADTVPQEGRSYSFVIKPRS